MRNKYREALNVSYLVAGLTALIMTAGAMYLFDRQSGARRRATLRDKAQRGGHRAEEFLDKARRDARQRVRGAPAPRVLAGAAGAAMMLGGANSRSVPGTALAVAGGALLARSLFNMPLAQMFGVQAGPEAGLLVQKTIHVYADVDEVYSRWRDLESFPKFMSHVREVRKADGDLYHWTVDGPAGMPVEWDARITADVPGELIAWRTVEGSPVQSCGVVQFEPSSYGGTRVHVRMSYRPPANVVGHTVASILGRSPKRQLDDDLLRFKSMVELRPWPTHAESQTRH